MLSKWSIWEASPSPEREQEEDRPVKVREEEAPGDKVAAIEATKDTDDRNGEMKEKASKDEPDDDSSEEERRRKKKKDRKVSTHSVPATSISMIALVLTLNHVF